MNEIKFIACVVVVFVCFAWIVDCSDKRRIERIRRLPPDVLMYQLERAIERHWRVQEGIQSLT